MTAIHYTVEGKFPFPLDMLRRDLSHAATPEDQAKIDMLTADFLPDDADPTERHTINLVIPAEVVHMSEPLTRRWESFGWSVPTDKDYAMLKAYEVKVARMTALRASALAKLTAEECEALAWFNPEPRG